MIPSSMVMPVKNGGLAHSEVPSDFARSHAQVHHRSCGLNGFRICRLSSPVLVGHVLNVVQLSAKKQMVRAHARRVVAFMEHVFSACASIMQEPRRNVSGNRSWVQTHADLAISEARCLGSRPQPASVRDFYLAPKTRYEGFGKSLFLKKLGTIVRPLNQVHFALGHALGCSFSARAFLFIP